MRGNTKPLRAEERGVLKSQCVGSRVLETLWTEQGLSSQSLQAGRGTDSDHDGGTDISTVETLEATGAHG